MRIVQLANFISPTSGGLRRAVDQLGRGYVAAGHQRLLVVPGVADAVFEDDAGWTVAIRSPQVAGGYRLALNWGKLVDLLRRFAPTSVEVSDKWTMTAAAGWARRCGVGAVLLSHERLDHMASLFLRHDVSSAVHRLNAALAKRYDKVVVTTRYSAQEWAGTGVTGLDQDDDQPFVPRRGGDDQPPSLSPTGGGDDQPSVPRPTRHGDGARAELVVVPLGVDLTTFQPGDRPSDPAGDEPLRLVHVGRLSREKSPGLAVATALELSRRGRAVRLDVHGVGPQLAQLRELAQGWPVYFHGHSNDRCAIADAYRQAHLALSVCPGETFGLAVLEALACGAVVVTADRGGARELVDASCAEWGAPDPVQLADAVERLADRRRQNAAGLQAAARARAERYPWSQTVARMLELHAGVAAG
ncbi:MAG: glycosyltransferase [Propionibacteriaceae bacterium]|jgi:alpha-1,6-mannosyltransferase|nr:glycosyltransferase [Propionibacteriaceae bacterium]